MILQLLTSLILSAGLLSSVSAATVQHSPIDASESIEHVTGRLGFFAGVVVGKSEREDGCYLMRKTADNEYAPNYFVFCDRTIDLNLGQAYHVAVEHEGRKTLRINGQARDFLSYRPHRAVVLAGG